MGMWKKRGDSDMEEYSVAGPAVTPTGPSAALRGRGQQASDGTQIRLPAPSYGDKLDRLNPTVAIVAAHLSGVCSLCLSGGRA